MPSAQGGREEERTKHSSDKRDKVNPFSLTMLHLLKAASLGPEPSTAEGKKGLLGLAAYHATLHPSHIIFSDNKRVLSL